MELGPILALLLTLVVHIVGMGVLYMLLGKELLETFRTRKRPDWGDGGEPPEPEPSVTPGPSGGGLPLPDAEQAAVRLREGGRIGDRYGRPARRPEHEPVRAPQRERA